LKSLKLSILLFRRKNKLKVDLGELHDEREHLSSFLSSNLKAEVTSNGNELSVNSEELTPQELKRTINKFVYHRKLNNTYWVALEKDVVRIHRFKSNKKKPKKRKRGESPSMFPHGF
jgi:hypothetical protein